MTVYGVKGGTTLTEEKEVLGERPIPEPIYPPQIPQGQTWH